MAAATYLAARVVGTWELYLFAFAFAAVPVVSWVLVALSGRRIRVTRALKPHRPLAGDEPELRMVIENRAWLPGPLLTVHSPLAGLAEHDIDLEVGSLAPRGRRQIRSSVGRVNRGVHHLPAVRGLTEDPLGLATAVHRVGDPLRVVVYPRIAILDACVLCPYTGLKHDWSGQQSLPSPGASEFRGIRPHQPGEPLSHIDWKSTAKTGILMRRETDEPAGAEATVLLDGTSAHVVGASPDTNFETAVRVAGSIADFVLRAKHTVSLVLHEKELRRLDLSIDGHGRNRLMEALAETRPQASAPLTHALKRLRAEHAHALQTQNVTVISLSLDHGLIRTLIALREEGVRLSFVYVAGGSFVEAATEETAPLLPFLPPRQQQDPRSARGRDLSPEAGLAFQTETGTQLPAELRAGLLTLSAAGITCVTVARGDDLTWTLGPGYGARRREARRA